MEDQLTELVNLQREQNQLLKRYLWRLRFSLLSLLLITTATAVGLGFVIHQGRSKVARPTPTTTAAWPTNQPQRIQFILDPEVPSAAPLELPTRYDLIKTD
jgi:hypothetical protein